MIKSVTVINYLNEKLTLELMRPEKSGFVVKKIDGLGPVKANINTTDVSTRDGSSYNSARTSQRNIVIYLQYLFQGSIEDMRLKSYRYFPLKKPISLIVETDNRTLKIDGYVESNEPDIFSKDEGTQISIICPNPYFYTTETTAVVFYGTEPKFEFPVEFEMGDEFEFSSIIRHEKQNVYYSGDVDVGLTLVMRATGDVDNVEIFNIRTRGSIRIDSEKLRRLTDHPIVAGDEITICTVRGRKSAMLTRNGEQRSILNSLSFDSDWFQLTMGDNLFGYTADDGAEHLEFMIVHDTLYEGV